MIIMTQAIPTIIIIMRTIATRQMVVDIVILMGIIQILMQIKVLIQDRRTHLLIILIPKNRKVSK